MNLGDKMTENGFYREVLCILSFRRELSWSKARSDSLCVHRLTGLLAMRVLAMFLPAKVPVHVIRFHLTAVGKQL